MDWNALGTWAAVVVALGIALKDTFERWRARTARHLVVTATVLPEVTQTHDALKTTIATGRGLLNDASATDEELADVIDSFLNVCRNYALQGLAPLLEREDPLPEHMLIPLAKAITLLRMIGFNGEAERAELELADRDTLHRALTDWCDEAQSVVGSLDWVVMGAERKLKSHRWARPELLGW